MISKSGIYAIKALIRLVSLPKGDFAGAAEVAEKTGAPKNYMGKLFQQLAREGILVSRKGTGGGFRLAREAGDISLYQILEPIDGLSPRKDCFLGNETCSAEEPCSAHQMWVPVRDAYLGFLKGTTIEALAADNSVQNPKILKL